jgi:hypothetical protein
MERDDRRRGLPARMPAGVSARDESSVAVLSAVMPHLRAWLGRDLTAHATGVDARAALLGAL